MKYSIYLPFTTYKNETEYVLYDIKDLDFANFLNCSEDTLRYLDLDKIVQLPEFHKFLENIYSKTFEKQFKADFKNKYEKILNGIYDLKNSNPDFTDEYLHEVLHTKCAEAGLHISLYALCDKKLKDHFKKGIK